MRNYTYNSKINIITIFTTNLRVEISTNKEDFISIYYYKVAKINNLGKKNINNINKDIIVL